MMRKEFNEVVQKVPHLTADGVTSPLAADFFLKRQDFLNNALYLQQANDAVDFLRVIGKSTRFSQWQKNNCVPERISSLIEWNSGRPVSPGAVIVAALSEGFTMGGASTGSVYFNFLPRQIETEMMNLRRRQLIKQVIGA
ncbi:MAG: hypothetical protein M3Q07_07355 [Pseudobdellovibrionaceae bacterium]|uniref:hypothetical protein n=1 Tax=Oligoflexus sp. TaxID=1971216 RepID=UPI0027C469DF|nr:hypothetical protein [Oligoflexus sp.]MDQ3231621.1 hypothetical protein [Pseudobdellovibrionaceae bacterium]HYX32528.1 hypothetical protein [Oligoflexus sp.]